MVRMLAGAVNPTSDAFLLLSAPLLRLSFKAALAARLALLQQPVSDVDEKQIKLCCFHLPLTLHPSPDFISAADPPQERRFVPRRLQADPASCLLKSEKWRRQSPGVCSRSCWLGMLGVGRGVDGEGARGSPSEENLQSPRLKRPTRQREPEEQDRTR